MLTRSPCRPYSKFPKFTWYFFEEISLWNKKMLSAPEGLRMITLTPWPLYAGADMLTCSPCSLNFPNLCDKLSHFVTHPGIPPESTSHISDPPIFRRPSIKNLDKSPLVQILFQLFAGVLSGGLLSGRFCPGWFLSIPVLSEYICYIRKLNITLNFMFRMYDKKNYKW